VTTNIAAPMQNREIGSDVENSVMPNTILNRKQIKNRNK
jgi:hypothetical protein